MPSGAHIRRGFTLVELIVSMALFIIVVFITTSAFLTLSTLNKKASTTRIAMDNLSITVESMAREIRTGSMYRSCDSNILNNVNSGGDIQSQDYGNGPPSYGPGPFLVPQDCVSGAKYIVFLSSQGDVWLYRLTDDGYIRRGRVMGSESILLTDATIKIDKLMFYVMGAATADANQPRVNIVVQGTAGTDPRTQSKFNIYTSVTQRAPK